MTFFSKIKNWLAAHKLISAIIAIILTCALCVGGWFGWQHYQYTQTSQYALEKIKQNLAPPQPAALAKLIDFNGISGDLADAISKNFSFYLAGPEQDRNIRHVLQTALLRKFMTKEEPSKIKTEESEEKELQKDLNLLPNDFVTQLLQNIALRQNDSNSAYISTKINHPQLGKTFTLIFALRNGPDGWKVRHLANAAEVTSQIKDALLARHNRLREVFEEKNNATTKKMNELIPIESCSANAGLLSDGKTLIMVVHVIARNRGSVQVNNFNLDTEIISKEGKVITRRFLNNAQPVAPGEDFNHRWSFELDSQSNLGQEILSGVPVSCKASWQTLGLGNAQVWHIEEVPNPDRVCAISGHEHPEGFCLMPVFKP